MAITVTGGLVSVNGDASIKATVNQINFPNSNRDALGRVPIQAAGVMTIKNVPDRRNFAANDVLNYGDGNNNNNATLTVNSVVGPTKYNITRTA